MKKKKGFKTMNLLQTKLRKKSKQEKKNPIKEKPERENGCQNALHKALFKIREKRGLVKLFQIQFKGKGKPG